MIPYEQNRYVVSQPAPIREQYHTTCDANGLTKVSTVFVQYQDTKLRSAIIHAGRVFRLCWELEEPQGPEGNIQTCLPLVGAVQKCQEQGITDPGCRQRRVEIIGGPFFLY